MASSRRTRRRQQKSLHRHQLRLEGLEKRSMLTASSTLEDSSLLTVGDNALLQDEQTAYVSTSDTEAVADVTLGASNLSAEVPGRIYVSDEVRIFYYPPSNSGTLQIIELDYKGVSYSTWTHVGVNDFGELWPTGPWAFDFDFNSLPQDRSYDFRLCPIYDAGRGICSHFTWPVVNSPASIASVTSPAAGAYLTDDVLSFDIAFDEIVYVAGTPQISLDIGGQVVLAPYVGGSGTSTLHFQYFIQDGDLDENGISISSPVLLNGGLIRGASGRDAILTFTPPDTTGVLINRTEPTVTITYEYGHTSIAGEVIEFTATFPQAVTVDTVAGNPSIVINVGPTVRRAEYHQGSGSNDLIFWYVVQSGDEDTDGLTLPEAAISLNGGVIKDFAGNLVPLTFTHPDASGLLVDGVAPSAIITATPPAVNIGRSSTLNFTLSENSYNFRFSDLNTTSGRFDPLSFSGSGSNYTVEFIPDAGFDGVVTISINAGAFTDVAGNPNTDLVTLAITVSTTAPNNRPVLTPSITIQTQLEPVAEDAGVPVGAVGTLVSSLIDSGGARNNFSDVDGDLPGIAITNLNLQGGSFWFSSDNGFTWHSLTRIENDSPLLLKADALTRVYFKPPSNYNGVISDLITFKAWDRHADWLQIGSTLFGKEQGDRFGSVTISDDGETLVVVAPGAVGELSNDNPYVQVYRWNPEHNDWYKLGNDLSGYRAVISDNGSTIAVVSDYLPDALLTDLRGQVIVYRWVNDNWTPLGAPIRGSAFASHTFGYTLSLSGSGDIVAIGDAYSDEAGQDAGHASVYHWSPESLSWNQKGTDINGAAAVDHLGHVDLSDDGLTLIVGARLNDTTGRDAGHARVYSWDESLADWLKMRYDLHGSAAHDSFGHVVSISSDGTNSFGDGYVIAVGAKGNDGGGNNSGQTKIFGWNSMNYQWVQRGADIVGTTDDLSGWPVSLSDNGLRVAIGSMGAGHVRIYEWMNNVWTQIGSDIDQLSIDNFPVTSSSLSGDGTIVAVGARSHNSAGDNTGATKVFRWKHTDNSLSLNWNTASITITPGNRRPVLVPSITPQINPVAEDAGAPVGAVGTLVSSLIDSGGALNNFSDADGDLPGDCDSSAY